MIGLFELIVVLLPFAAIGVSMLVSTLVEHNHLNALDRREQELSHIVVTDLRTTGSEASIRLAELVSGQAVIGCDLFKSWLFRLRNLVGGESGALQSVLTRARREALVRMLEEARALGASEVINVRFESSNILSGNPNRKRTGAMCAEVYAFGTAIVR